MKKVLRRLKGVRELRMLRGIKCIVKCTDESLVTCKQSQSDEQFHLGKSKERKYGIAVALEKKSKL